MLPFTEMTMEQVKQSAPSIFQTQQKSGLSEHYVHIPTDRVINDMIELGWKPCQAVEIKARKASTKGFQRHMIKFFNPDIVIEGSDGDNVFPQILLTNSHDGLSSFKSTLTPSPKRIAAAFLVNVAICLSLSSIFCNLLIFSTKPGNDSTASLTLVCNSSNV